MDNRRNYYRILHVQADAHEAVIKASYRTLMHKLKQHPDLGGDHWNATVLNEAYAVLTHSEKRAAYDAELMAQRSAESIGQQHQGGRKSAPEPESEPPPRQNTQGPPPDNHRVETCGFCSAPAVPNRYADNRSLCVTCQSPMLSVEKNTVNVEDRRAIDRMSVLGKVCFYTHWPQAQPHYASIKDLSPYGMQLITQTPVEPGNIVKIDCEVLNATATVRSCIVSANGHAGEFFLGLEFRTLKFQSRCGTFVSDTA